MRWLSPSSEGRDMRASLACSPHCCSQVGTGITLTDILALSDTFTCDRKGQRVSPSQAHTRPRGQGLPSAASREGCVLPRHSLHSSSEASRRWSPASPVAGLETHPCIDFLLSCVTLPIPSSGSLGSLPKIKALVSQILLLVEGGEG